jgi:branched-subunit amino acid aminotransferase/4-amino-4-deoxychorismate lyase
LLCCDALACAAALAPALQVWAPTARYQMPGITRGKVLELSQQAGIPARELDFSLTQVGSAQQAGWACQPAGFAARASLLHARTT